MHLDIREIKKQITEPRNKAAISRAIYHQNRIRFHAEKALTPYITQPVTDFLAYVSNLIPADKFKVFKTLFRYPVKTNEVTGVCFDKLSRIFDGRNPAFNYQFMNSEQRDDWEYYRQHVLKEPEIWSTKGWEYFKTEINSVLIVDLPKEQSPGDNYPQPYFYWLPIEHVISYKADKTTGVMHWIIFRQDDNRIAVIDDERYRVFTEEKGNIGELLIDSPHDLGYCPARFFWNEPLSLREPDVKASPLTTELESLDWFLFYHLSKNREFITEVMDISKNDSVLEIGSGCGEITGALAREAKEVTCIDLSKRRSLINAYKNRDNDNIKIYVGNYQDIKLDNRFDVITLIGVFEYSLYYMQDNDPFESMLISCMEKLNENGRLYIAIENRLGAKYFSGCKEDHVGKEFVGIEGYPGAIKARTFSCYER